MKRAILSFIGNGSLHLGWAIYGQECDCGTSPSFNWLARQMPKDDPNAGLEVMENSVRFKLGSYFVDLSNKFDDYL